MELLTPFAHFIYIVDGECDEYIRSVTAVNPAGAGRKPVLYCTVLYCTVLYYTVLHCNFHQI